MPCDPVVVLTIGKETKSTQICEDSIDPVYNEAIAFVTYSSPFDIAKDVVHLRVLNTQRMDDASLVGQFKVGGTGVTRVKPSLYVRKG